jgi:hypothetical protein
MFKFVTVNNMPVTNLLLKICGCIKIEQERILMNKSKIFPRTGLDFSLVMDGQISGFVGPWQWPLSGSETCMVFQGMDLSECSGNRKGTSFQSRKLLMYTLTTQHNNINSPLPLHVEHSTSTHYI